MSDAPSSSSKRGKVMVKRKKSETGWSCPVCTCHNTEDYTRCCACGSSREAVSQHEGIIDLTHTNNHDGWHCPFCTLVNDRLSLTCTACLAPNPDATRTTTAITSQSNSQGTDANIYEGRCDDESRWWICPQCDEICSVVHGCCPVCDTSREYGPIATSSSATSKRRRVEGDGRRRKKRKSPASQYGLMSDANLGSVYANFIPPSMDMALLHYYAGGMPSTYEVDIDNMTYDELHDRFPVEKRTVDPLVVSALPEVSITKEYISKLPRDKLDCSICLETFLPREKVKTLTCLHQFHTGCIDEWLLRGDCVCPICKTKV